MVSADNNLAPWARDVLNQLEDWRIATIAALMLSIGLVSLAYMFAIAFEMNDLKGWASNEMSQIIATAIILLIASGVVAFVDEMVRQTVNDSNIVNDAGISLNCKVEENCLDKSASFYLDDYIEKAKTNAEKALESSINEMRLASWRFSLSCSAVIAPIPCLQTGTSFPIMADSTLKAERAAMVYDYYQNLLISMYAQKFFVEKVAFKLGPILLGLGVFARSLFFSRKTGGLLMAVAFGIMFVFPLMYVFDWLTLQLTFYGDSAFGFGGKDCPAECQWQIPIAYKEYNSNYYQYKNMSELKEDISLQFKRDGKSITDDDVEKIANDIAAGEYHYYELTNIKIYSCQLLANNSKVTVDGEEYICARPCRELPYPYGNGDCAKPGMQQACSALTEKCKLIRHVKLPASDNCPNDCKIIPPLKSNCNEGSCLDSRFDCRVTWRNDLAKRPSLPEGSPEISVKKCNNAKSCPASLTANDSCVYVFPNPENREECANCLTTEEAYLYDPPIRTSEECKRLCTSQPSSDKKKKEATELMVEGNIGPTIITNVSKMMIPAYLLPLFNILVTVLFIRSFSRIFGGDIEIPGLAKVL